MLNVGIARLFRLESLHRREACGIRRRASRTPPDISQKNLRGHLDATGLQVPPWGAFLYKNI
jgi:hypothetical protein